MSDSMNKQATIDRLRAQLAQAEADRDTLAAEVMAARILGSSSPIAFEFCRQQWDDSKRSTDTSGALDRAKEAK